jgi:hypothetical protein
MSGPSIDFFDGLKGVESQMSFNRAKDLFVVLILVSLYLSINGAAEA